MLGGMTCAGCIDLGVILLIRIIQLLCFLDILSHVTLKHAFGNLHEFRTVHLQTVQCVHAV